jgi:DNA-binding GntR family transcriptional regulator
VSERTTLSNQVYEKIKKSITSLEYSPDSTLQEATLAAILGVSRTPIREATMQLLQEGWLIREGRSLRVKTLSREDMEQIFEIREILEKEALVKTFTRGNPRLIAGFLDDLVQKMEQEDDFYNFTRFDLDFHATIVKNMGNDRLTQFWCNIYEEIFRCGLFSVRAVKNRRDQVINEHGKIIECCWKKDLECALKAMEEHHESSLSALLKGLQE